MQKPHGYERGNTSLLLLVPNIQIREQKMRKDACLCKGLYLIRFKENEKMGNIRLINSVSHTCVIMRHTAANWNP